MCCFDYDNAAEFENADIYRHYFALFSGEDISQSVKLPTFVLYCISRHLSFHASDKCRKRLVGCAVFINIRLPSLKLLTYVGIFFVGNCPSMHVTSVGNGASCAALVKIVPPSLKLPTFVAALFSGRLSEGYVSETARRLFHLKIRPPCEIADSYRHKFALFSGDEIPASLKLLTFVKTIVWRHFSFWDIFRNGTSLKLPTVVGTIYLRHLRPDTIVLNAVTLHLWTIYPQCRKRRCNNKTTDALSGWISVISSTCSPPHVSFNCCHLEIPLLYL